MIKLNVSLIFSTGINGIEMKDTLNPKFKYRRPESTLKDDFMSLESTWCSKNRNQITKVLINDQFSSLNIKKLRDFGIP